MIRFTSSTNRRLTKFYYHDNGEITEIWVVDYGCLLCYVTQVAVSPEKGNEQNAAL